MRKNRKATSDNQVFPFSCCNKMYLVSKPPPSEIFDSKLINKKKIWLYLSNYIKRQPHSEWLVPRLKGLLPLKDELSVVLRMTSLKDELSIVLRMTSLKDELSVVLETISLNDGLSVGLRHMCIELLTCCHFKL